MDDETRARLQKMDSLELRHLVASEGAYSEQKWEAERILYGREISAKASDSRVMRITAWIAFGALVAGVIAVIEGWRW